MEKDNLNHCKGKRLWEPVQLSKMKGFTAGTRLLFNRGEGRRADATSVKNIMCKNIIDFEVNCCD